VVLSGTLSFGEYDREQITIRDAGVSIMGRRHKYASIRVDLSFLAYY